jgi:acyl-CoA synthetase (AMP-forming)/AMP-acid ligase II/acyl carrier protein
MSLHDHCTTLVDLLRLRASLQGNDIVYRFLETGDVDGPVQEWTYAHVDLMARGTAAMLQDAGLAGERVLLLFPPGLEFIAAFLGCLYAGAVAVPTYPPDPGRLDRTLPRLRQIAQDSGARCVLTTSVLRDMAEVLLPQAPELGALQWLAIETPTQAAAHRWRPPALGPEALAFLQYTSGSTGIPKGVMLTHANVLHNERLIGLGFDHSEGAVGVGWLPLFHDMGLIGNVIQPLYLGFPCTLMSPIAFLQRPLRWLQAVSRFHATSSGGPNFAYELCVRKVTDAELEQLDLSSWTLAFNGAEPTRAETLRRFADRFSRCGFRKEAFYPCYGLAEATLFVTGGRKGEGAHTDVVDAASGSVAPRELVSCGWSWEDLQVVVVNPATGVPRSPGEVGEIWVAGPSVAGGYWGRPEESAAAFGARLATGEGPFLRTGDLGLLSGRELYVTGRLKDLIIVRGRNLYPQDVELTAEGAHPAVRPGCSAAFAVEMDEEERLVIAAEVEPGKAGPEGVAAVADAIRRAVAEEHSALTHAVVLLEPRSIPKTSSGKIQRYACRAGFLAGHLDVIESSVVEDRWTDAEDTDTSIREALLAAALEERPALLERFLQREAAKAVRVEPGRIDLETSLPGLGLDSFTMIELERRIESALGLSLPSAFLWRHPTIGAASRHLIDAFGDAARDAGPTADTSARPPLGPAHQGGDPPLSSGQLRLWFLDRLAPGSPVYNVHFGVRMRGALSEGALEQSLNEIIGRHAVLRTRFQDDNGRPRQVISTPRPLTLTRADLQELPEPEREIELRRLSAALGGEPFDLATGPLTRASLVTLGQDDHALLLTQHHTVTDGWSISLLARELATLYRALSGGAVARLPSPSLTYADYAWWQRSLGAWLDDHRAFWARRLAGLPRLLLPSDRPRSREPNHRGAKVSLTLSHELTEALKALGRREGCTLFVVLFASYVALLHRYTAQDDFGVGTVVANRNQPEVRDLIGCLINTLVLRCDLSGNPTFEDLARRARAVVVEAFAHAELPFEDIVGASNAARGGDDNPLFQVNFVLENLPAPSMDVPGMVWSPLLHSLDGSVEGIAKYDLDLIMTETASGLIGELVYRTELFEAATMERMVRHFTTLLQAIAAAPGRRLWELPLLSEAERHQSRLDLLEPAALDEVIDRLSDDQIEALLRDMAKGQEACSVG